MYITFVCPGMPFNGDFVEKGRSLGGSETACFYVAREMAKLGHKVVVFTNDQEAGGNHDGVDYAWCGPPNQRAPLGEFVHNFMETAYTDVLVLQRASGIMQFSHSAKVALWWHHDVALLRALGGINQDAYRYDGLIAVSDWHRKQISDTWNIPLDHVGVVRNSVDLSLYDDASMSLDQIVTPVPFKPAGEMRLLYQSRPERGIDYLVSPGGIMDQLAKLRPEAVLYVCGYDNTTEQMRDYYENVYSRCKQMPNVRLLGYFGKRDLARLQKSCDVLVYPGQFEETSCITAMEAQAAGLPMVASKTGALPETCEAGTRLIPLKDGRCNAAAFVEFLSKVRPADLERMRKQQLATARDRLGWKSSATSLQQIIDKVFARKQSNPFSMVRTMLDRSDVLLAKRYLVGDMNDATEFGEVSQKNYAHPGLVYEATEIEQKFRFLDRPDGMREHYDSDLAVSELDKDKNLDVTGNLRFQQSCQQMFEGPGLCPRRVLDYGCQKGHYIWSMAQSYPDVEYVGVDVSPRVVAWAQEHCKVDGVKISFFDSLQPPLNPEYRFDGLMLGEVLEHVTDPGALMNELEPHLADSARVVITTPFGDWEGKDFNTVPGQPRYHVHHFERADLEEMFSQHDDYLTICVPSGRSDREPLGSYVTSFTYRRDKGAPFARDLDWGRKLRTYDARNTLSFCAIVRNGEATLLRSLLSVREIADEFIFAVDHNTTDRTVQVLEQFRDTHAGHRRFEIVMADSPIDIGFDEARNRTVDMARGDWIMWMDADEEFIHPERVIKYLRNNQYEGLALAQHHMSADPVGILTTDWPVRIFRNVPHLRFRGFVHEHPDDVENLNGGPRCVAQLRDVQIMHHGYTTESVRRARFHRNLPLIQRDRRDNPDRMLGRMLWMRDLAHLCMFELEANRGQVTDDIVRYAQEGIVEWEKLLADGDKPIAGRMIRDGLEFYSTLVSVLGVGFEVAMQIHASRSPQPFAPPQAAVEKGHRRVGRFLNREHLDRFVKICLDEQTVGFDNKYF